MVGIVLGTGVHTSAMVLYQNVLVGIVVIVIVFRLVLRECVSEISWSHVSYISCFFLFFAVVVWTSQVEYLQPFSQKVQFPTKHHRSVSFLHRRELC